MYFPKARIACLMYSRFAFVSSTLTTAVGDSTFSTFMVRATNFWSLKVASGTTTSRIAGHETSSPHLLAHAFCFRCMYAIGCFSLKIETSSFVNWWKRVLFRNFRISSMSM